MGVREYGGVGEFRTPIPPYSHTPTPPCPAAGTHSAGAQPGGCRQPATDCRLGYDSRCSAEMSIAPRGHGWRLFLAAASGGKRHRLRRRRLSPPVSRTVRIHADRAGSLRRVHAGPTESRPAL